MTSTGMWGDIQIGDRVRVKAGGPILTVEAFDGENGVYCTWDDRGQRKRVHVDAEAVEKVGDDPPGAPKGPAMSSR